MSELTVSEAVAQRSTVRAYTDQAVPEAVVRDLLAKASRAPSGGNVQPWQVHVLSGEALQQTAQAVTESIVAGNMETPEFPTYPPAMVEPWRSRRFDCGERMYDALGIPREDKGARIQQVLKNYSFFGAPVGMVITMDRSMGEAQAVDVGVFIQTLMLLAQARGLDTCPQLSWSVWPNAVRQALAIPEQQKVVVGIALGYGQRENPLNHLQQPRANLDDFATFSGF